MVNCAGTPVETRVIVCLFLRTGHISRLPVLPPLPPYRGISPEVPAEDCEIVVFGDSVLTLPAGWGIT